MKNTLPSISEIWTQAITQFFKHVLSLAIIKSLGLLSERKSMLHQAKNIVIFSAKNDVVSINQRNMDSLFYWIKAMSMQIENPTLPSRKDDMGLFTKDKWVHERNVIVISRYIQFWIESDYLPRYDFLSKSFIFIIKSKNSNDTAES